MQPQQRPGTLRAQAYTQPLLQTNAAPKAAAPKRAKLSVLYGADQYLEELKKKYEIDHEIASLKAIMPDEGDPNAGKANESKDKMLQIEKDDSNRSKKTGRLFPTPNKPDPMPPELAFLFTKITPEQMMYMWNILTLIFVTQCLMVVAYCAALAVFPDWWWSCTVAFGVPFAYIAIQKYLHRP
ncbi:unnamed protein product [Prorocentrum cordatum]|uniref:Glycerophosphocholine acyltransferase 1 n=1 Tax=Prorocentrum cordatum TaxID=2364126 RepID=A0ABN9V7H8_9DINO|nr:unnamed protein product [Polarella glacialis]